LRLAAAALISGKLNGAEDHRSTPHPGPHSQAGDPDAS
jgi:hypothetical protein